jgi:hypothetical protein
MARHRKMPSTIRIAATISLAAAAGGIGSQIIEGAGYPTVSPGVLILIAAAAGMGFVRWRWAPAIGTVAAVGAFAIREAFIERRSGLAKRTSARKWSVGHRARCICVQEDR